MSKNELLKIELLKIKAFIKNTFNVDLDNKLYCKECDKLFEDNGCNMRKYCSSKECNNLLSECYSCQTYNNFCSQKCSIDDDMRKMFK